MCFKPTQPVLIDMLFESDRCYITSNALEPQTHWRSIYIAAILSFIGSVQFSLYFSALWPYMKKLDQNISENFFGTAVAIYSLGQVVSAPTFGAWSNRIKEVRRPLACGLTMMFLGNLVYIFMEIIPIQRRYILLMCRFIVGIGSGNVALLRSYAATASHKFDRSRAIAFVTCGQAVGMTLGPAFQLIFTPFHYPGPALFGLLHLNLYSLPGYLACLINILGVIALYRFFEEKYVDLLEEDKNDDQSSNDEMDSSTPQIKNFLPMYDIVAVLVCYASRFVDMWSRSIMETLGLPIAMMMFSLDERTAVQYVSFAQTLVGSLTLIIYLTFIFGKLEHYINLRIGCISSLFLMFTFHLFTYSWPFLPNHVHTHSINNATDKIPVGCDSNRFDWCSDLTAVNMWFFYTSYVLSIGIAFPILTVTLTTLFSKILGPRRQGTEQGLFQASSATARMISPLINTMLYTYKGLKAVWLLEISLLIIMLNFWFIFYRRMVDLKIPSLELMPNTHSFSFQNEHMNEGEDED